LKKYRKKRGKAVLLTLSILLAAAIIIIYDSAKTLSLSEYSIEDPSIPESFAGFKIVQLSDIHGACFGKGNSRLIKAVRRENPDIIALTGDLISCSFDLPVAEELIKELSDICHVYFVSGNHEYASGEHRSVRDRLRNAGIEYLSNSYVLLEKDGESIVLAGIEDPNGPADMMSPEELSEKVAS